VQFRKSNSNKITMSIWATLNKETCEYCNINSISECCNKCGDGVCIDSDCSWQFPHYHNTMFIICNNCFIDVNKKLNVLIDYNKLNLLKEKIRTNNLIGRPKSRVGYS